MIEKLLPPILVEGIWSFLRHAGFYQMCIKDFSKISKCICNVLEKDYFSLFWRVFDWNTQGKVNIAFRTCTWLKFIISPNNDARDCSWNSFGLALEQYFSHDLLCQQDSNGISVKLRYYKERYLSSNICLKQIMVLPNWIECDCARVSYRAEVFDI